MGFPGAFQHPNPEQHPPTCPQCPLPLGQPHAPSTGILCSTSFLCPASPGTLWGPLCLSGQTLVLRSRTAGLPPKSLSVCPVQWGRKHSLPQVAVAGPVPTGHAGTCSVAWCPGRWGSHTGPPPFRGPNGWSASPAVSQPLNPDSLRRSARPKVLGSSGSGVSIACLTPKSSAWGRRCQQGLQGAGLRISKQPDTDSCLWACCSRPTDQPRGNDPRGSFLE